MSVYDKHCPVTDVTVLIYNNERILPSFFSHLYTNTDLSEFNLIAVDNNSQDKSVEFVKKMQKKHSNIALIENEQNYGVAGGRNIAAKYGQADFIVNLDSDQLVSPGWLKEQHAIMEKGFDFVGTEGWFLNRPTHPILPYFPSKRITNPCHKVTYIGGGNCLMKKDVFEDIGFYDEQFSPFYFEDSDASFAAIKKGYRLAWNWKTKIMHLGGYTKTNFLRKRQFKRSYERFKKKWAPWYPALINMIDLDRLVPNISKEKKKREISQMD